MMPANLPRTIHRPGPGALMFCLAVAGLGSGSAQAVQRAGGGIGEVLPPSSAERVARAPVALASPAIPTPAPPARSAEVAPAAAALRVSASAARPFGGLKLDLSPGGRR